VPAATVIVYLSSVDKQRFGIRTARASQVTLKTLPATIEFCHDNEVRFLVARCSTSDLAVAQEMEQLGFLLMDTLVYYSRDLDNIPAELIPPSHQSGQIQVRTVFPGEAEAVKRVAQRAFRDYFGHYHADARLDPVKCDETYADWALQSCRSKEVADEVLVALQDGGIKGFLTLQLRDPDLGEGILFGVDPETQGQGIGRLLMMHAIQWFLSRGIKQMQISTQIINLASQMVWAGLGFRLSHSYYTFHKWFDENRR
jgi:GNAT superfamily N-acetyltransferase